LTVLGHMSVTLKDVFIGGAS